MMLLLWVILCSLLAYCNATSPKVKPHILYIVADDMGWSDIGFTQGIITYIAQGKSHVTKPRNIKPTDQI